MMPADGQHIVRRTISFTSPRQVFLRNPVAIEVTGLFIIAIVFTIWPLALEHSPISFEQRGVVHHVWHYTLLGGSALALFGMFSAHPRRLQLEFVGVLSVALAVALNLVAQVERLISEGAVAALTEGVTGFGIAARGVIMLHLLLRCYILVKDPEVNIPIETSFEED